MHDDDTETSISTINTSSPPGCVPVQPSCIHCEEDRGAAGVPADCPCVLLGGPSCRTCCALYRAGACC